MSPLKNYRYDRYSMVCTGGRSHPKRRIGWLSVHDRPRGGRYVQLERWKRTIQEYAGTAQHGPSDDLIQIGGTLTLPCPTCPASPQISQRNALQLIDGMKAHQMTEFDVSLW